MVTNSCLSVDVRNFIPGFSENNRKVYSVKYRIQKRLTTILAQSQKAMMSNTEIQNVSIMDEIVANSCLILMYQSLAQSFPKAIHKFHL